MTTHMIRVWSEPPNNTNHLNRMQTACEDWAARYSETLTTQRLTLSHSEPDESEGDVDYTTGYWRFDWSEDATALLDDLEADLQGEVDWARIRYHSCNHDDPDSAGSGCSWEETREFGSVPVGL